MRIHYIIFLLLTFSLLSSSDLNSQKLDHVLGEVIIEVKNDKSVAELKRNLSSNSRYGSSIEAVQIMKTPMNLWVLKSDPNTINEIHFLRDVIKQPQVLLAQKNHISQLRAIPNDERFEDQWQYINTGVPNGVEDADLDMELAWDIATGGLTIEGDTIVACIIDDGCNPDHPDLRDNLWLNHQEIPDNGIDDDGNGYVDDYRGWNAYTPNNDNVYIGGGHGMPVAGIVGAKGNNEIGVAGVNWNIKLMIVRGGGPESTALTAYAYPYTMRKLYNETNGEKGAFVVCTNSSWGVDEGQPEDAPIWCDFYNLLGEEGILNFGATINGNKNVDIVGDLPTGCESNFLVSVTNINREDEKVVGAGFGLRSIDLGAYGRDTYTLTSGGYGGFGGTSAATPHAAGTAALLYSADCPDFIALAKSDPALAALVVKDCILHGVDPNPSLLGITTTGGRLNANNSIQNLMSTCGDCTQAFGTSVGEITDVEGKLTYYDNGSLGTTSIRYRIVDTEDWIEINDIQNGFQFANLNACEMYEYQIKTVCASNPDAEYQYARVFTTDGCCDFPTGIDISLDGVFATIVWNEVIAATNFIVEFRNISDSDWTTIDVGDQNSFIINGILECEFYEVRIQSKCNGSNEESEFTEIFKINGPCDGCTLDFCTFTNKITSDEWIETVEIENLFTNNSGVDPAGYGSYLGEFDIVLSVDSTYTLNLTPGFSSTMYSEFFSAYIDFNQSGDFDENEAIYISDGPTMEGVSGTFTVPSDALNGTSRMRIIMRFNALNGPCDNGGFEYGEVEDYCVTIQGGSECPSQLSSTVVDSTFSSITFEIEQSDQVDFYLISYREKGTDLFDTVSSNTNLLPIAGLTICTPYEYRAGYICDGNTLFDTELSDTKTKCDVSVNDPENILSLNLYPNPTSHYLNIEINKPIENDISFEIYSANGTKVKYIPTLSKGETKSSVDVRSLPSGLYFLKATSNNQSIIRKWLKN